MTITAQTSVKLSPRMLARAEGLRDYVGEESGIEVTRADVLRRAIALGLRALERLRARALGVDERGDDDEAPTAKVDVEASPEIGGST
jgi:hypothetical protein